jgi:transcriptional regulator PpsR
VKPFRAPRSAIGDLDAETAATMVAAAADITLVLDADGVIRDVAGHSDDLMADLASETGWIGRPWSATVTIESRVKVEAILREAAGNATPRWRHLNHPTNSGADMPIQYAAVRVGADGRVVAFGRDLRAMSDLQQRLVNAQQSMERDYARMRHAETRYRLLFQMSTESVLILDAVAQKVLEANPAARALCGEAGKRLVGGGFADAFAPESRPALRALLAAVHAAGRADDVRAMLIDTPEDAAGREVIVSASLLREENSAYFLVRLTAADAEAAAVLPRAKARLLKLVESAPDGFVVTGTDGRVVTANAAFLEMVQMPTEEQVRGESLDRWVGRPGVDLDVLIANLRQRGTVRLFASTLNGEYGGKMEVEISATSVINGGQPSFGFAVRNVGHRLSLDSRPATGLSRSVEQLTELIGRVSLKDLVRESTDMIERLYIEAALKLTGDNRASAAEMLGLSRQSLYVKLRRYGLGDLAAEGES